MNTLLKYNTKQVESNLFIYVFVYECFASTYVCAPHVSLVPWTEEGVGSSELQAAVSHHMGAGD